MALGFIFFRLFQLSQVEFGSRNFPIGRTPLLDLDLVHTLLSTFIKLLGNVRKFTEVTWET